MASSGTEESRRRFSLSQELCRTCPIALGQEIAITGSVARGTADDDSDVELNVWVDHVACAAERRRWLASAGCEDIVLDRESSGDGTVWSHVSFRGMLVEVGWQAIGVVDREITSLLRGEVTDHRELIKAWVLVGAVPLRSIGGIQRWQGRLASYPEAVQAALISEASHEWRYRHFLDDRWSLAQRGERFAVTQQVCRDLESVCRILFSVNRRWEPDWKWLRFVTRDLPELPLDFHSRVDGALAERSLPDRVKYTLQLVADALALASTKCDVSAAALAVRGSLDEHDAS